MQKIRRVNRLLVGAPGIGKTETVLSAYDHVEVLLLSSSVEEDIYGLPYREGELEKRTIPPFLVRLRDADAAGLTTCLFLDELDKARREVADTLLTLVANRKTPYGLALPNGTEIIAAANQPAFGGGDGVSIPMLNRFSVQEFEVNPLKWKEWAYTKFEQSEIRGVIDLFANGTLPLLLSSGEGLALKIASPRSVTYALATMQQFISGNSSLEETLQDITGLLPPSISAHIISTLTKEDEGLITQTKRVVTRQKQKKAEWVPYRGKPLPTA